MEHCTSTVIPDNNRVGTDDIYAIECVTIVLWTTMKRSISSQCFSTILSISAQIDSDVIIHNINLIFSLARGATRFLPIDYCLNVSTVFSWLV